MSVFHENTLQLKDLSDASDEHQLPIVFWIVRVSLNMILVTSIFLPTTVTVLVFIYDNFVFKIYVMLMVFAA